jgi:thioredoxin-related protein
MDRDVLETKEIGEQLGRGVAYFRVNGETAPHIARENNLMGYPTTILLDETGKKLIQIPGFIGKKDFKTILAYLTGKHYKKMPLIDYLKKEGVRSRG